MRTILCPRVARTRSCFIPQKDAAIRGRVLFVYDRWLVRPSFLLRREASPTGVGLTDTYAHRRPPSSRAIGKRLSISIVRLAAHDRRTVQLSRSPVPQRTAHGRAQRGLIVYHRSEQAATAGRNRRGRNGTPSRGVVQTRSAPSDVRGRSVSRRCVQPSCNQLCAGTDTPLTFVVPQGVPTILRPGRGCVQRLRCPPW